VVSDCCRLSSFMLFVVSASDVMHLPITTLLRLHKFCLAMHPRDFVTVVLMLAMLVVSYHTD